VRRGPYRLLRHPSYTGALLTVVGFGIGTGSLVPALVAIVPIVVAFLWRIRVEERMLADAFPDAWPTYARETRRLIPFLW
jgi:protein-S-isoprenylcysteine O-methyltransferase